MLEFIISQIKYEDVFPSIGALVGIAALAAILWNGSRKLANMESDNKTGKEQHVQDIAAVRAECKKEFDDIKERRSQYLLEYSNKIAEVEKKTESQISQAKTERIDQINKLQLSIKDDLQALQDQINGIRSDVKEGDRKITEVNTKIVGHADQLKDLKQCDKDGEIKMMHCDEKLEKRINDIIDLILRGKDIQAFTTGMEGARRRNDGSISSND